MMKLMARLFAGPGMVAAGVNHFVNPDFYTQMIPAGLPAPETVVYVSGIAEIIGALGTMHPKTRRASGVFLILLLIVIYPANINMAINADRFKYPEWVLWARLPLQFLFVYWVWKATLQKDQ